MSGEKGTMPTPMGERLAVEVEQRLALRQELVNQVALSDSTIEGL